MAHELTLRADGRAEMAFVGETPWHGLGQSVSKGASIGVWQREAGMDWAALEGTPACSAPGIAQGFVEFEDYKALYRSDTHAPLAIMGSGYQVVQPREVLEFFREMTESGGWHIHTAGTMRGGRKLWAMASRNEFQTVGKRKGQTDEVAHNLVFATSLDGSMKTTVLDTAVRVVCANTLGLAMRDNKRMFQVSHRSVFDADAVKLALGLAEQSFDGFMEQARQLAAEPISLDEARDVLGQIFGKKAAKPDTSWLGALKDLSKQEGEEGDTRSATACLELFQGLGMGSQLASAQGTRWGLLNAVTQHVDWNMGRSDDTRLDSAFFGRGQQFKQSALELLTA